MRFLLANDDGYDAKGIAIVQQKLQKYGEVFVVAPREHMSAKGCSITFRGIGVEKVNDHLYIVDGTPADCTAIGLNLLDLNIDVVVSGCNHGINMTYDTMYSGTVGVCLESLRYGVPAIAFSAEVPNFDLVEKYFDQVMEYVLNHKLLSSSYFINVNFPMTGKVDDIKLGRLYYRKDRCYFEKNDEGKYFYHRDEEDVKAEETDCYQVHHNIISITPISPTFFNESIYQEVKNKLDKE